MTMRRVAIAVFLLATTGATGAAFASPITALHLPVHAMFSHDKLVHFDVKNETSAPLKLKCGADVLSVDPGKVAQVKVPAGTRITFVEANGPHAAGELLAEAGSQMNGTTISVH